MPGVEQLHHVKAGDRPSASQHNIIVDAAKAKQAGGNVFGDGQGYAHRINAKKLSRIAQFRVDEEIPDPIEARDYLTCVEIDDGEIVSDQIVVALSEHTKPLSALYAKNMLLFAAEVIDDFGVKDDDGNIVMWLEIVPPVVTEETGSPIDLSGSDSTARTSTWTQGDQDPIHGAIRTFQRVEWDATVPGLVAFEWSETLDAYGKTIEISAETKRTIITYAPCIT